MAEEETINEQPEGEGDPGAESNASETTPEAPASDEPAVESSADDAPAEETPESAPTAAEQLASDALAAARAAVADLDTDSATDSAGDDAQADAPAPAEPAPATSEAPGAEAGPIGSMMGAGAPGQVAPAPFTPEQLTHLASIEGGEGIDILSDVDLNVKIELGKTKMLVEDVLKLTDGAVVELDKLAGDPVDIYVNERHVARGEVLILNDNFCVRVSEILESTIEDR